jgi:hypothetical protein
MISDLVQSITLGTGSKCASLILKHGRSRNVPLELRASASVALLERRMMGEEMNDVRGRGPSAKAAKAASPGGKGKPDNEPRREARPRAVREFRRTSSFAVPQVRLTPPSPPSSKPNHSILRSAPKASQEFSNQTLPSFLKAETKNPHSPSKTPPSFLKAEKKVDVPPEGKFSPPQSPDGSQKKGGGGKETLQAPLSPGGVSERSVVG